MLTFFKDEAIGGWLILFAAVVALVLTNAGFVDTYDSWWRVKLSLGIGDWNVSQNLKGWINEGLMALFFLVVGLEIKREAFTGELKLLRSAMLPILAAFGGMIAPALLYLSVNINQPGADGWAIPMATDIAIAVGVLMLFGSRVPSKLKVFLLTLAVFDDIGATIAIAVFYNRHIEIWALAGAITLTVALFILIKHHLIGAWTFGLIGVVLWVMLHDAGLNAGITGVILGLVAPTVTRRHKDVSIAENLEKFILPISTFIVVPLFAFANAGTDFDLSLLGNKAADLVAIGVFLGLVVGKVSGVVGATWLLVKLEFGELPADTNWKQFIGIGFLTGIGFTISIFVTELAFVDQPGLTGAAKFAIFAGSIVSGALGILFLKLGTKTDIS